MKPIIWLLGLLVLVVVGTGVFVWSGAYNIAADDPHWPLTEFAMETARERSIAAHASGIAVPVLDDESMIRGGAGNYDAMCAGCHLQPGVEQTELSDGLFPAPPNLGRRRSADPAAAFWVIKHGIKMSGMPAWGKNMDDESIWGMVAFLRQLPEISPERYRELVAASGGHSHGTNEDESHGHDDAPADVHEEDMKTHVHEDSSQHEHKN